MEDNKALKIVYTFFLGLLLAIFVGVGINTFYSGPKSPEYPQHLYSDGKEQTEQERQRQEQYDKEYKVYTEKTKPYERNVSIITLVAAVVFLALSLSLERKIRVIADGILLGGVFTLLYSIMRSFASEDTKYTFLVITIGLIIAFYLGYRRFLQPQPAPKKKR